MRIYFICALIGSVKMEYPSYIDICSITTEKILFSLQKLTHLSSNLVHLHQGNLMQPFSFDLGDIW